MAEQKNAIGYSITANVNGDRQVVFQHFVAEDTTVGEQNAMIDRIMDAIDRQQARYKIPELQAERRKLEGELALAARDLAAVEVDYTARAAARDRQLLELEAAAKAEHDAGYKEHVDSGRRGVYQPGAGRRTRINALESEKKTLIEAKARDEAERELARSNLDQNNKMRELRIKQVDDEIAELQAKVT